MRLSTHDASFIYAETASSPMHGVSMTLLDGPATYEEIFDFYRARVPKVPRLRQKLAFVPMNLAHPKWIDDPDFDLKNHLKRHPVPPRTTLEQAHRIALELGEPVLDRSRPLWMAYVLENVEGKTLLVQMHHHAFVDGATAVALTTVLTDPHPEAPAQEPAADWQPAPQPSPLDLLMEAAAEAARQSIENARRLTGLPSMMQASLTRTMERLAQPVMQAPWNRSLVGPKRQLATFETTLSDVKQIRSVFGGTLNDVAISVVMEGLAQFLIDRGERLEDEHLRLMCPVDVRGPEDNALDMGGNRVSALLPRLPAAPQGVLERLRGVTNHMRHLKAEREAEALSALQHGLPEAPPVAMLAAQTVGTPLDPTAVAAQWPLPVWPGAAARPPHVGFNCTLTNVPGPNWTQYVAGYRVINMYGTLMLGGNLGLGVTVNSYDGKLTFGFTAEPRLLPNVDELRDRVADAFGELLAAARSSARVSGLSAQKSSVRDVQEPQDRAA